MNKELRALKKQLEQLQKKDQTFVIKLVDENYLVKGEKVTEIDIIPNDLKVYEVDATDKQFTFIGQTNNEPDYIKVITVSEARRTGLL